MPSTSGSLTPGPNVTNTGIRKVCPLELADHLAMSADNAAWLAGLAALTHPGPAVVARVDRSTCGRAFMPGVQGPAQFLAENVRLDLQVTRALATTPRLTAEPQLKSYAR